MAVTLNQILELVGKLDDSPGDETPRERFRRFLQSNVTEIGQVRDYIEECLRSTGPQYSRALQDLVNHLGRFLGFEVVFGRYQGVAGEVGFDGLWRSPSGLHIVIEVKTTEAYAVRTSSLVGYVDGLISEKKIPDWDCALGLYVVGRPDPDVRQLENAIIAERRTSQLRIVAVDSLLGLAELMDQYDVTHEDVLTVLRPSGPKVDPIVGLMVRLIASTSAIVPGEQELVRTMEPSPPSDERPEPGREVTYWLCPVACGENEKASQVVERLVGKEHIFAIGEKTPARKGLEPGDWICFYAAQTGVVAHARVTTAPEHRVDERIWDPQRYSWVFDLDEVKLYTDRPVALDLELREKLDAFEGRDPNEPWSWFVQATRKVSEHDFRLLTNQTASR